MKLKLLPGFSRSKNYLQNSRKWIEKILGENSYSKNGIFKDIYYYVYIIYYIQFEEYDLLT